MYWSHASGIPVEPGDAMVKASFHDGTEATPMPCRLLYSTISIPSEGGAANDARASAIETEALSSLTRMGGVLEFESFAPFPFPVRTRPAALEPRPSAQPTTASA